jgi:hypothetical protein
MLTKLAIGGKRLDPFAVPQQQKKLNFLDLIRQDHLRSRRVMGGGGKVKGGRRGKVILLRNQIRRQTISLRTMDLLLLLLLLPAKYVDDIIRRARGGSVSSVPTPMLIMRMSPGNHRPMANVPSKLTKMILLGILDRL